MTRAQRNCDQLCVCVRHWKWTSYFLNCSWKRSLWPWRVSAGRPACTQRQVARNYLQTGRSGYFKTCLTAYTRILQNCKFPHLPFQRVRKRLFETELLVNFFFSQWGFENFHEPEGFWGIRQFREEKRISQSLKITVRDFNYAHIWGILRAKGKARNPTAKPSAVQETQGFISLYLSDAYEWDFEYKPILQYLLVCDFTVVGKMMMSNIFEV